MLPHLPFFVSPASEIPVVQLIGQSQGIVFRFVFILWH